MIRLALWYVVKVPLLTCVQKTETSASLEITFSPADRQAQLALILKLGKLLLTNSGMQISVS